MFEIVFHKSELVDELAGLAVAQGAERRECLRGIEGIIGRAYRTSLLSGSRTITKAALDAALASFMPSTQTLEREAQELAAIIECTDVEFLPPSKKDRMDQLGGRERLQERLTAIKQILEQQ